MRACTAPNMNVIDLDNADIAIAYSGATISVCGQIASPSVIDKAGGNPAEIWATINNHGGWDSIAGWATNHVDFNKFDGQPGIKCDIKFNNGAVRSCWFHYANM